MWILRCRPVIPCPPRPPYFGAAIFLFGFLVGKTTGKTNHPRRAPPPRGEQLLPAPTRLSNSPLKSIFGIPKKYGFLSGSR